MTGKHLTGEEARLVEILRGELPPERDPVFRLDVLVRLERQRFRRQLGAAFTSGLVAGLRSLLSPLTVRVTRTVSRAFVD